MLRSCMLPFAASARSEASGARRSLEAFWNEYHDGGYNGTQDSNHEVPKQAAGSEERKCWRHRLPFRLLSLFRQSGFAAHLFQGKLKRMQVRFAPTYQRLFVELPKNICRVNGSAWTRGHRQLPKGGKSAKGSKGGGRKGESVAFLPWTLELSTLTLAETLFSEDSIFRSARGRAVWKCASQRMMR